MERLSVRVVEGRPLIRDCSRNVCDSFIVVDERYACHNACGFLRTDRFGEYRRCDQLFLRLRYVVESKRRGSFGIAVEVADRLGLCCVFQYVQRPIRIGYSEEVAVCSPNKQNLGMVRDDVGIFVVLTKIIESPLRCVVHSTRSINSSWKPLGTTFGGR